jgi:hypothetical protein
VRVLVYVEGPSDRSSLQGLLKPIIAKGALRGIGINFIPLESKAAVLDDSPKKAADHLLDNPEDWVFALPDLYPMASFNGSRNEHDSFATMKALMTTRFNARADAIDLAAARRSAFRVHCLKHDLEALILASPGQLRERLKTKDRLTGRWRLPVENQNDTHPPKRIVESLFKHYRRKPNYQDTVDAPWILSRADLAEVRRACPQQFHPFVSELSLLADGGSP